METNFNKPNPRKILGYLMAFAMVFFTTSHAMAQNAVTITVGGSLTLRTDFSGNIIVQLLKGSGVYIQETFKNTINYFKY